MTRPALYSLLVSAVLFQAGDPALSEAPAPEAPPPTLEIRLEPSSLGLEVELRFTADVADATVAAVPEWGGSRLEEGLMTDVRIVDAEGGAKPAKPTGQLGQWRLDNAAGAHLSLRYRIPRNQYIRGIDGDSYYKPVVTPKLTHLIGHQSLLLPDAWGTQDKIAVSVRWENLPEGHHAVTSFGVGPGPHRATLRLGALRGGLFIAGAGALFRGSGDDPVHIFVAEGPWRFEPKVLADLAQRIVPAEREFFRERDAGAFLVSAIAIGPEDADYLSYGGTSLHDAFATFLMPTLEMDDFGRGGLSYLLAHEKAHTWIGGHVSSGEEPETAGYWFSEGVTDYYTPRLQYRAGLLDAAGVLESWNALLSEYVLSPVAYAPNSAITDGFWTDRDLQRLPYTRGAAVSLFLDQTERRRTGGASRLDTVLLDLIDGVRRGEQQQFTNAELRGALESAGFTAPQLDAAFATVLDGSPLDWPDDLLAPCAELTWRESTAFDAGFEVDESTGEVLSVDPEGPAHRAGLRPGDQLAGWSIHYGETTRPVEVQRRSDGDLEDIRFLPVGPAHKVPAFELADVSACAAML
ncbi:MAG: hypothetical protein AAGM22_01950 [Acidobacteriota bacterium]